MTPLLYTAELDLDAADVPAFLDWYAYRHAPDVYEVGLLTCACYRVQGGDMNLFDIYELPGTALFDTPRYRGLRDADPYMAPLMEKRRNKAHTLYEQRLIAPPAEPRALRADWIAVARFETADDATIMRAFTGLTGPRRVRYGVRGPDHPRNPTFRPRCMIVTEWDHRPALDWESLLPGVERFDHFIGERVYPWPDQGMSSQTETGQ